MSLISLKNWKKILREQRESSKQPPRPIFKTRKLFWKQALRTYTTKFCLNSNGDCVSRTIERVMSSTPQTIDCVAFLQPQISITIVLRSLRRCPHYDDMLARNGSLSHVSYLPSHAHIFSMCSLFEHRIWLSQLGSALFLTRHAHTLTVTHDHSLPTQHHFHCNHTHIHTHGVASRAV